MYHSTYCLNVNCAFLLDKPAQMIGREGSKYYYFPGVCNHNGGPEIDASGKCRYVELIGKRIVGDHESIDREKRCHWCGAVTVINDTGLKWCISNKCTWVER